MDSLFVNPHNPFYMMAFNFTKWLLVGFRDAHATLLIVNLWKCHYFYTGCPFLELKYENLDNRLRYESCYQNASYKFLKILPLPKVYVNTEKNCFSFFSYILQRGDAVFKVQLIDSLQTLSTLVFLTDSLFFTYLSWAFVIIAMLHRMWRLNLVETIKKYTFLKTVLK